MQLDSHHRDGCDRIKKEKRTATERCSKLDDYNEAKKNNELNQIESPTVAPATITIKRDKRRNNKAKNKKKTRQIWLRRTTYCKARASHLRNK